MAIGLQHGFAAVGVTGAAVFDDTLSDLVDRRRRGLNGSMQFTYRNPERSTDPTRILAGARSLVVGAWSYRSADPPSADDRTAARPTAHVARYAWRDHYAALRSALAPIAARLEADGWRAAVVCDDNALVDRAAAHRAGLGWFGKNTLLLLPGLGSWFVLGTVVTDAPLRAVTVSSASPHGDGCGSCARCMAACPTGALVSPGILDARRCLAWLVQAPGSFPEVFREALGDRIYGCDECQTACPINRVHDRRDPPPPPPAAVEATVDLVDLLAATDEQLIARHGRWYIPGREARYLRRNALVALGNVGNGTDPATEQALRRALADPDPLITEHAAWAARRLGRSDLVDDAA